MDLNSSLNLGKATNRGTKRCIHCGTINGTRGSNCKNKKCNASLRDTIQSRITRNTDAIKLTSYSQNPFDLYSIRVSSLTNRGFVQLPILQELDCDSTKCYIDGCKTDDCEHIKLANNCSKDAQILDFKPSLTNSLIVEETIKKEILNLHYETDGPLVQRLNKSSFVIRCSNEEKFPFGLLHVYMVDNRLNCTCSNFLKVSSYKCIHYYLFLVSLLSDDKLTKEFRSFLNKNQVVVTPFSIQSEQTTNYVNIQKKQISILSKNMSEQYENETSNVINRYNECNWLFDDWLSNISEQISETLNYKNEKASQELILTIPNSFFECFKTRIGSNNGKIRLPNDTQEVYINDRPPFGIVTKYIWNLLSISQIQSIFGTKLEIQRTYEQKPDGTFKLLNQNHISSFSNSIKVYLAVGMQSNDSQSYSEPFKIEWIPNIYLKSQVGELRFKFMVSRVNLELE